MDEQPEFTEARIARILKKAGLPYSPPEAEMGHESSKQPELVPAHELTDGQVVLPSADNGLPFPQSRGVFRAKLD